MDRKAYNQATKAVKLARVRKSHGLDVVQAGRFTEAAWAIIAFHANVRPPSETTQAIVVALLEAQGEEAKACV